MKILIVSYFDDNFGDMLIKTCFEGLLKVVLKNCGKDNYSLFNMPLKEIDEDKIKKSDIVFFAGGGLIGNSYLDFYKYVKDILDICTNFNIPVYLSSVGINNMDNRSNEINSDLQELLNMPCIKKIAVRENKTFFEKYNNKIAISEVCDPAVWVRYVYNIIPKYNAVVGINVVRGGLFKDNNIAWKFKDEINYLISLKEMLEKENINYVFYTNGSFLDNVALRHIVKKYNIAKNNFKLINTSRELVETISNFKFVCSIRMHSAIISYSFGIPSINLIWNEKIKHFYQNIKREDDVFYIDDINLETILKKIRNSKKFVPDYKYMMTLYSYLFEIFCDNYDIKMFDFKKIAEELKLCKIDNDYIDMFYKINKGENSYLSKDNKFKKIEKELKSSKKLIDEKETIINKLDTKNKEYENSIKKLTEELVDVNKRLKVAKKENIKLRNSLSWRITSPLRRIRKMLKHKK